MHDSSHVDVLYFSLYSIVNLTVAFAFQITNTVVVHVRALYRPAWPLWWSVHY